MNSIKPIEPKKDFSAEQLAAIEEMAANGFTFREIAFVVGEDKRDRCSIALAFDNKAGIARQTYQKGFLRSQLELRQRIFLDAKHGSSPAQAMAMKIMDHAEYKLNSE